MKTYYKIIMVGVLLFLLTPMQAQLFGGQIKPARRFPPVYNVTTTMVSSQHVTAAELPYFFDDRVTYVSQDVVVPDMKDLRFHQGGGDIMQTAFNAIVPVGGKIVITWSNIEVGIPGTGLGWIVELRNGGATSQGIINTIPIVNVMPNASQVANGNDVTLTINLVADANNLILKSSEDNTGLDPILLEIEVFDNNNVKIPVN